MSDSRCLSARQRTCRPDRAPAATRDSRGQAPENLPPPKSTPAPTRSTDQPGNGLAPFELFAEELNHIEAKIGRVAVRPPDFPLPVHPAIRHRRRVFQRTEIEKRRLQFSASLVCLIHRSAVILPNAECFASLPFDTTIERPVNFTNLGQAAHSMPIKVASDARDSGTLGEFGAEGSMFLYA